MNTITSRVSKILTGSFLIGLTLTSTESSKNYEMLYSLIALPIIFSGMFDWRPIEKGMQWLANYIKPQDGEEVIVILAKEI